jgi:hypothetical protein
MSITDLTNGRHDDAPAACDSCGAPLTGGRFCAACGAAVADVPEPPTQPQPVVPQATFIEDEPRPPRRRVPVAAIVAGGIVLVAAIVAAAALALTGDDGPSADTVYRQQVAKAFGPVLGANRQLSQELGDIRGTKPSQARIAVRRAQQATTRAAGAVGALSAPAGSSDVAGGARQVLDRETAYLSAVSSVLSNPSDSRRGQLVTLSSNLTSAMSAAGPSIAGTSDTVSGADRLTSWSQQTARTLAARKRQAERRAARKRAAARGGSSGSSSSGGGGTQPPAVARGTSCGGGLYAGPNTTCAFAENVREAWGEAPGSVNTVRVFSPVTGQTYTMSCSPASSGIACSGGNNASVTFG